MTGVRGTESLEALESLVLTDEARVFLVELERRFGARRVELLTQRQLVQSRIDAGWSPGFLDETRDIRQSDWTIASFPDEIADRRVEITGPVSRKMMIQALNSGARVYMADFEDSHSPTWRGTLEGQVNLLDAVRASGKGEHTPMTFDQAGKRYELSADPAALFVRPRGWHLDEAHFEVDGRAMSASLFDFGLYFFHNARERVARGTAPYFYLPKMESHLEARLWNDVFVFAQERMGLPRGTIKATVLIETILAAFEMDEILWELREHSAGLNCGRWDYIFSFIKKFRNRPEFLLPDRQAVTMTTPFLDAYVRRLIQVCHRRGAHAIGGMAAQIPIKGDEAANTSALEKVRADKLREVSLGHDGTWVAHPALVQVAREVFDQWMPAPNQIVAPAMAQPLDEAALGAALLEAPRGETTRRGFRLNIEVALDYITSWLQGVGCVPLHHLMEDAATAEISRAQLWQWIHHPMARFADADDGARPTVENFRAELGALVASRQGPMVEVAARLLDDSISSEDFPEFLTLPAYAELVAAESSAERSATLTGIKRSGAPFTSTSSQGETPDVSATRRAQ